MRLSRSALWIAIAAWGAALAYATLSGRVLYADGGLYVMVHLREFFKFDDYDFHRSFASFISQAPILLGQKLHFDRVASLAALYNLGSLGVPAVAFMAALVLSWPQPRVFAFTVAGAVVFGFGLNFINSEANLLFGLAWLSVAILALDRPAPVLRGFVLPLLALVMMRVYEGMLLAGPVLCVWTLIAGGRCTDVRERVGLGIAALLFVLGTAIGLGGWLAPRDWRNAAGFANTALNFVRNPHALLLLAAIAAWPAIAMPTRRTVIAGAAISAVAGIAFIASLLSLQGYYAYDMYYFNRGFLAFLLPASIAAALLVYWRRPAWFLDRSGREGYWVLLIPLLLAVAGDVVGTRRWNHYVHEFCVVLNQPDMTPAERLDSLKSSGAVTAWPWTHPVLSVLLRPRGSNAMVANDPGQFEPNVAGVEAAGYRGFCEAPFLGALWK